MTIWIDAQLSPFIAAWINSNFPNISAKSLRSLGLRDAKDCGNTSNAAMCEILKNSLPQAIELLSTGEDIVEISNKSF